MTHLARYTKHPAYLARITPPSLPAGISRHQDPRRTPDPRPVSRQTEALRAQPIARNSATDRVRQFLEDIARSGKVLPYIPDIARKLQVHPELVRASLGNLRTLRYIRTISRQTGPNLPAEWICRMEIDGAPVVLRSLRSEGMSFENADMPPPPEGSPAGRLLAVLEAASELVPIPRNARVSEMSGISTKQLAEIYRKLATHKIIALETQRPDKSKGYEYRIRIIASGKVLRTIGWKD